MIIYEKIGKVNDDHSPSRDHFKLYLEYYKDTKAYELGLAMYTKDNKELFDAFESVILTENEMYDMVASYLVHKGKL